MSLRHTSVEPKVAKSHIARRSYIDYEAIMQDVKRHKGTVVWGVKRQAANRAEKRLTQKMGFRVAAYPYLENGAKGYLFARPEDIGEG